MRAGPAQSSSQDFGPRERVISAIQLGVLDQPSLEDLARVAQLSPSHLQRVFKRWAGVSPKQFLSFLTVEAAKARLESGASVLDAALDAGLSGPSRLHDHFVVVDAMTPGEYKAKGEGITVRYGLAETPFGLALVLLTERGLAGLTFCDTDGSAAFEEARSRWPLSDFKEDAADAKAAAHAIFCCNGPDRPLHLKGTNWQIQVWKALLRVPANTATTYGAVADSIGSPGAWRAAGNAAKHNPIAYVIPCHRVLRATGLFGGYKWGTARRQAITGWEAAHNSHFD